METGKLQWATYRFDPYDRHNLFDADYYRDLEMWVRGHSRSLKLVPLESLGAVSYSPSIVTMAICCWRYIVFFARYSELSVENREIFLPHLYLAPPQGVTR